MSSIRKYLVVALLAAISVATLYGCGGDTPTPVPPAPTATEVVPTDTPVPPPPSPTTASSSGQGITATGPAADLISKALAAMKTVKSVHITTTIGSSLGATITGS